MFYILLLLIFIFGEAAVIYVVSNWGNPQATQIIVGSVLLGLFIGLTSAIAFVFLKDKIEKKPVESIICTICVLALLVATLVYSTNAPKNIRQEIPVVYLISTKTKDFPQTLRFYNEITDCCYFEMKGVFKNYKEKLPEENARRIEQAFEPSGDISALKLFQNLTEYLIPYFIGNPFVVPGLDSAIYHKELLRRLGYPDRSITGKKSMPLEGILGDFRENTFYGCKCFLSKKGDLRLPKDTIVELQRESSYTSKFIIKNEFTEIVIGVQYLPGNLGLTGFLPHTAFPPSYIFGASPYARKIEEERKSAYRIYGGKIFFDVTFSKWKHGYREMKYYEQWANDLFRVLEMKFAWGSPVLLDWPSEEKLSQYGLEHLSRKAQRKPPQ